MALSLHEKGLFTWPEWAAALATEIKRAQASGDPDTGDTYYHHWLAALEGLVKSRGVASAELLEQRRAAWDRAARATPHGKPIDLAAIVPGEQAIGVDVWLVPGRGVSVRVVAGVGVGGALMGHVPSVGAAILRAHCMVWLWIIAAYIGSVERGLEVLAPLRAFGAPPVDLVRPMPYVELQAITDAGNPPGRRNYWRSENLATLPDEAIDALIACAATATSPASVVVLAPVGGAVADVPADATALANRSAPWLFHCYGIWTDTDDARHIGIAGVDGEGALAE